MLILSLGLVVGCSAASDQPVIDPSIAALAEAGVNHNVEWQPHFETINDVDMALVPAGCFMMGSDMGHTPGHMGPIHGVCFDEPFWIDVYEVTQEQFQEFGGEADRESCFQGANRPRECISWFESEQFCQLRSARLPTEAEWEYAARGPDSLRFPWGEEFSPDGAVYPSNSLGETAQVGSKSKGASWIGAQDLSGNVWEWVGDWYGQFYYESIGDGAINPPGPDSGSQRVLRGGSWDENATVRHTTGRYYEPPEKWASVFGFRCVVDY